MAKAKRVTVTLTLLEAEELLLVAGNGYGDAEFYVNTDGSSTGYGGHVQHAAYCRAVNKMSTAIREARGDGKS